MQAPHRCQKVKQYLWTSYSSMKYYSKYYLKVCNFSHKAYLHTDVQPRCVATLTADRKFQVIHDFENSTNTVLYTKEGL